MYQSRFLISYAQETEPLRKLLVKGKKWHWSATQQEAFEKTKRLFAESVLLKRPDFSLPYILYCDASYHGIGCVLTQEDREGNIHCIAPSSRGLSQTEMMLFPTEIEICAVYHGLQKFRDYIFNHKTIVRSDAISLSFMRNCKLTNSRTSRFIHEIMQYDIEIEYIQGPKNIFADLLSRLPRNEE